jgi:hypothetical protein
MSNGRHFFEYRSLGQGGRIRLIKLDPDGKTRPEGFEIEAFGASTAPEYYALSYRWGVPDRSDFVICNGARLRVTPQLKLGLEELLAVLVCRNGSGSTRFASTRMTWMSSRTKFSSWPKSMAKRFLQWYGSGRACQPQLWTGSTSTCKPSSSRVTYTTLDTTIPY